MPFYDYGVEMLGDAPGEARVALHVQLLGQLGGLADWRRRELGRLFWCLAGPGLSDDDVDEQRVADRRQELNAAWPAVRDHAERSGAD